MASFQGMRIRLLIAAAVPPREFLTMSAADGANLLLGLVAVVGVVSTLGGMFCLFWVTRAPPSRPPHPAGHDISSRSRDSTKSSN